MQTTSDWEFLREAAAAEAAAQQSPDGGTPHTPAPPPPVPEPHRLNRSEILVAAAALVGGTLLTFAFLATRSTASTTVPGAPSEPAAPVAKAARAATSNPAAWTDANRASWLGGQRRGMAYEVAADNTVGVWMRTVHPSLVVRCAGSGTEVFVFTDSPAKIERGTPDHTVRYTIDAGPEQTEPWPDSDGHDALFAPDGRRFAQQLSGAQSLRFTFTPHNAAPATVQFQVAGLAALLERSAKECAAKP